jgi:3-methylcrotonyl-CoA carboxylase alpha subunit
MALEAEGGTTAFSFQPLNDKGTTRFAITMGTERRVMTAVAADGAITVFDGGEPIKLTLVDPFAAERIEADAEAGPVAPMPGTVIALLAAPGEIADAGTPMLILEAMKMEHTLRFPVRGRVSRYLCAVGDFVAEGTALADFEAEGAA